jgi:hypothetical protein
MATATRTKRKDPFNNVVKKSMTPTVSVTLWEMGQVTLRLYERIQALEKANLTQAKSVEEAKEQSKTSKELNASQSARIESLEASLKDKDDKIVGLVANQAKNSKAVKEAAKAAFDTAKTVEEERKAAANRAFQIDRKAVAANLVVKNLPTQQPNETREQTDKEVSNLFDSINFDGRFIIKEVYRHRKHENSKSQNPPLVVIRLEDPQMKAIVFRSLRSLENPHYKKVSFANEVPASARAKVAKLERIIHR